MLIMNSLLYNRLNMHPYLPQKKKQQEKINIDLYLTPYIKLTWKGP